MNPVRTLARGGVAAALLALVPSLVSAHTGVNAAHDLAHGWMHPLVGADHLLAMVAVGLWAAQRGGRALWLLPLTFVGTMVVGFALAIGGVAVPGVELMIVGSVLVLGAVVAAAVRMPTPFAALLVAAFALFHGHAHGAEMPAGMLSVMYGSGLGVSTALLHGAGIALVLGARRALVARRVAFERLAGAAVAVAGVLLLLG